MKEFELVSSFYGDRKAHRSQVSLINHILEGLDILSGINASELAKRAYCIHPLIQSDKDFVNNLELIAPIDGRVVALAVEYRRVANAYLSRRVIASIEEIELSPLKDVNDMLIADKIQNRKDFNLYHKDSHPRSKELDKYFENWFKRLNINSDSNTLYGKKIR